MSDNDNIDRRVVPALSRKFPFPAVLFELDIQYYIVDLVYSDYFRRL